MRIKIPLVLFLLGLVFTLKAQKDFLPGTVITLNGDSIKGFIEDRGLLRNSQVCNFKKLQTEETLNYYPNQIESYILNDYKFYVSKEIVVDKDTMQVFLEYLIDGIVDVYIYRDLKGDRYFIEKEDVKLTELKKSEVSGYETIDEYVGVLKYVFNDSYEIQKKSETVALNQKNIIKLAEDYHYQVCDGEKCIVYQNKLKSKFGFELFGGMDANSFNVKDGDEKYSFKSNRNYSLGITGYATLPSYNKNLALNLQIKYGKFDSFCHEKNEYTYEMEGENLFYNGFVSYTFPKGFIRPIFLVGFSYISSNIAITRIDIIKDNDEITLRSVNADFGPTDNYMGLIFGIGGDIQIYKELKASVKLNYYLMKSTGAKEPLIYYKPLSLTLGFKI